MKHTLYLMLLLVGISASAANVERIELKQLPEKNAFYYGDTLQTDGGIVSVTYNDGSVQDVPFVPDSVKNFNSERVPANLMKGISIDCARKYCRKELLEAYIDSLSGIEGAFLTLHFADNENVGIACKLLGQTGENAIGAEDGSFTNPSTGKKFLTENQVRDIAVYAKQHGVTLIPELDMPGHMGGFFRLARNTFGDDFVRAIAVNEDEVPGELNITEPVAVEFASNLLDGYMDLFEGSPVFCIGADEYWTNYGERTINFINQRNQQLKQHGFTTRIYNDLIRKEYVDLLNHDIQVLFWSHDGATNSLAVREERKNARASLPDLQDAGFTIILTNSYYLYFVPSARNTNEHDLNYTVNDIRQNWNLAKWDNEYLGGLSTYKGIVGTEVALWQENASEISDEVILKQMVDMYHAMNGVLQSDTIRLQLTVNYGGKQAFYPVWVVAPNSNTKNDAPKAENAIKLVWLGNGVGIWSDEAGTVDVYSYEGRCLKRRLKIEEGLTPLEGLPPMVVVKKIKK